jgi:hypothetical protein
MSSEVPKVRPSVVSLDLRNALDRYRGFRHEVRNVYTFNLDIELVDLLVKPLEPTMQQLSRELLVIAEFLEEVEQ